MIQIINDADYPDIRTRWRVRLNGIFLMYLDITHRELIQAQQKMFFVPDFQFHSLELI